MPTLKIRIEESKFISHNNVNVESFTEREVKGNGWIAKIYPNGNLICITTGTDLNGTVKERRLTLTNKIVKEELKIGNKAPKIIKLFQFDEWKKEGVIGLSGGLIDKRRVYFRLLEFQDFLDENKISSIRHINPNIKFKVAQSYKEGKLEFIEELHSDGEIEMFFDYMSVPEWSDGSSFKKFYKATVTNATWVCKTSKIKGKIINRVLYTELSPFEIEDLPK